MSNIDEAECDVLRGRVKCLTRQEQLLVLVPDSHLGWFCVTKSLTSYSVTYDFTQL